MIAQNWPWKVFRISTVHYNWPMSVHAPQAFSIAHCTDSEDVTWSLFVCTLSSPEMSSNVIQLNAQFCTHGGYLHRYTQLPTQYINHCQNSAA